MRKSKKVPLWFRRIDLVKAEMKAVRFPRTAQEGFRQCVELSETALRWFRESIRDRHPGASGEETETERRLLLARFSAAEARRLTKWKKERDRYLQSSIAALLERIVACFRRARVPYVLIGAWALAVWGRPRATNDVDILVLVKEDDLPALSDRIIQAGLTLDETWMKWNPLLKGFQLRFQFGGVAVDILRPRDAHDEQVFKRKQRRRLDGRHYWLVSPEDFILQKLKLGRPRDFEDTLSVLERSGKTMDKRYLQRSADRIGVSAELRYILSL